MALQSGSLLATSWCVIAVATLGACSTGGKKPPGELLGESHSELTSIPTLPSGGTAQFAFTNIAPDGATDGPWDISVAVSGTGATRTLNYNVLGNAVTRQVLSDGRQPDTDTEQHALVNVLSTLPPAGTSPTIGATWTINLPAGLVQQLAQDTAAGYSSTRPVFSGTFTGFYELVSPADFTIARATVRMKRYAVRPSSIGGTQGIQPGLTSVGVVDFAVGTGAFSGIIPLRVAYLSSPGEVLPDSADWSAVASGPHQTDVYCLTSHPGIPSALIEAIPVIAGAPYPSEFATCQANP